MNVPLQVHPVLRDERQRRLLWEAITMVDRDTLNDNLERVNVPITTNDELRELADVLDPDEKFQREWATKGQ